MREKRHYILYFTLCLISTLFASNAFAIESEESRQEANADFNLREGNKAFSVGDYNTALRHYLVFTRFAENDKSGKFDRKLMSTYMQVGNVYNYFKNSPTALSFFQKGLAISQRLRDKKQQMMFITNELSCYTELGQLDKAENCNEKMFRLKQDGSSSFAYIYNKGYIEELREHWSKAKQCFIQSMDTIRKYHLDDYWAYPYSELYKVYEHEGNYAEALDCLSKYEQFAKRTKGKSTYLLENCYRGYISVYRKLGDNRNVLIYQDKYIRLQDSLMNVGDFLKTTGEYQVDNERDNENTISDLNTTVATQRIVLVLALVILVLLICIIYIVYHSRQTLRENNIVLYHQNQELMAIDRERKNVSTNKNEATDDNDNKQADLSESDANKDLVDRIRRVMETTDAFCDPQFSLQTLATMVESNTNYVSRAINSLGQNFRTFINEYRIREARLRLADQDNYGKMTIQAIAESVGFKSLSSFGTAFKKFTGMTPASFQRMALQDKS